MVVEFKYNLLLFGLKHQRVYSTKMFVQEPRLSGVHLSEDYSNCAHLFPIDKFIHKKTIKKVCILIIHLTPSTRYREKHRLAPLIKVTKSTMGLKNLCSQQ